MAEEFNKTAEAAISNKKIPGGAAIAVHKTGKTLISKTFGNISLEDDAQPWALDSTFAIASSTKLLTSISVLQCVTKGLLNLNEDVSVYIPELANPQILTGFDEAGKPQLKPAKGKVTLRHLLTHASGYVYYGMASQSLNEYRNSLKMPFDSGTMADYTQPLVFEPGTSWEYGPSTDWAGQAVERVTGQSLDEYMQKNIAEPLGMKQTTFHPLGKEAVMSKIVGELTRDANGALIKSEPGMWSPRDRKDNLGGIGLYTSSQDYIKVLTSLLLNDGKLLSGEMYEELFRGQLGPESVKRLHEVVTATMFGPFIAPGYPITPDTQWNYALGGAIIDKDIQAQAAKGTLYWSGFPNNYWYIDRANGVCGYYGSWFIPPADAEIGKVFTSFQKAALVEAQKL